MRGQKSGQLHPRRSVCGRKPATLYNTRPLFFPFYFHCFFPSLSLSLSDSYWCLCFLFLICKWADSWDERWLLPPCCRCRFGLGLALIVLDFAVLSRVE